MNNSDDRYEAMRKKSGYVYHAHALYGRVKTEASMKYLKCVKGGCTGLGISTATMHFKLVLRVVLTWAGAIRLPFIPVAAPATET